MIKTPGLILHKLPYSETSLILKVITAHSGLITLMAKGARGKNKLSGVLDHFNLLDLVFRPSPKSDIWQLREASITSEFRQIKTDIQKQSCGLVLLELHMRHLHGPGLLDSPELFRQLLVRLEDLNHLGREWLSSWLSGGILGFCESTGIAPVFEKCIRCNHNLSGQTVPFSIRSGGAFCERCRYEGIGPWRILNVPETKWFNSLQRGEKPSTIASTVECEDFLLQYLYSHSTSGKSLKSLPFYRQIIHGRSV